MSTQLTLPQVIRHEISKLPAATRDVVTQQLRKPPAPPIIYEEAVKQLASIRDIEITKRILFAAEGLALWGRMHEDNRAIIEAQKLKAHALRQMFLCAKELGEPYEVLREKKIHSHKASRAEELASFLKKEDIDVTANKIKEKVRPEHLVGKIAEQTPLARKKYAKNLREQRNYERQQARQKIKMPENEFFHTLVRAESILTGISEWAVRAIEPSDKKRIRAKVADIMETLDRIDEACK